MRIQWNGHTFRSSRLLQCWRADATIKSHNLFERQPSTLPQALGHVDHPTPQHRRTCAGGSPTDVPPSLRGPLLMSVLVRARAAAACAPAPWAQAQHLSRGKQQAPRRSR